MEGMEDTFVKMMENLNIEDYENARHGMLEGMTTQIENFHGNKSPAEITELKNQYENFITNIFNRMTIPLETKIIDEREFLFYKLADDKDICPKLKEFERKDGKFIIKHKNYTPIEMLTEVKEKLVIDLVIKLHKMGIFYNNLRKENIVYNEYEGVRLINFSEAIWIDQIDEQFLLNNSYGKSCSNIEELLKEELDTINEIFLIDSLKSSDLKFLNLDQKPIKEKRNSNDHHFHSSDEENVYY